MSIELTAHLEALVFASFHGELTPQQREELSAWIAASPEHARFYYAYSLDERSIDRVLHGEQLGSTALGEAVFGEADEAAEADPVTTDAAWSQVVDDALAARRRHELEEKAQRLLQADQADQAESRRLQMFERRRRAMEAKQAQSRTLVIPKWAILASAAAVGLAVVLAVTGVFEPAPPAITQSPPTPDPVVRPQPSTGPAVVAVVDSALEARWASGAGPVSGDLTPGTYELETGLVRLSYDNGVSLVVQAPARFRVRDDMHLSLDHGRLSAIVPTAEGHGFTVTTPELEVVDLGTEFGVVAGDDGISQAHVYQGRITAGVRAAGRDNPGRPIPLGAGQAVRARGGDGAVVREEADELAVVRHAEFTVQERAAEGSSYDRWLAWSYAVRRDPTVFAYYPFDNQGENENALLNRAAATNGTLNGQFGNPSAFPLSAPQWADGRWPGKDALNFRSSELDHVLIPRRQADAFDELEQVTVACWVRVSDVNEVHHLVTKRGDGGDSLNFVWVGGQFADGVGGEFESGHREYSILCNFRQPGPGQRWLDFESTAVLRRQPGWALLAVTYDNEIARFYLDGQFVGSYHDNAGIQGTNADLLIGGVAVHLEPWAFLDGEMDELVIWGRALDHAEIDAMYQAGRP